MHQDSPDTATLVLRRKRLLYLSRHRGMKEADLLIGGFAERHLPAMDARQLDAFERLLTEDDADLLDWAAARRPVPDELASDVFEMIKNFKISS